MTFRLVGGDAIGAMQAMAENSVDAIVTDPPYGLEFMGKEWDRLLGRGGPMPRTGPERNGWSTGPERPTYRAGIPAQEWHHAWATEALRILKPGGHLLAFGGTRTYHRLACAIEDAGFEIRDCIAWMYGSGFPKSLDVSKAIDKRPGQGLHAEFAVALKAAMEARGFTNTFDVAEKVTGRRTGAVANWQKYQFPEFKWWPALRDVLGMDEKWGAVLAEAEREKVGNGYRVDRKTSAVPISGATPDGHYDITAPATPEAQRWNGWGTALKPAFEPIVLARKPLAERNVAANVQRWGTGALNIDGCRIEGGPVQGGGGWAAHQVDETEAWDRPYVNGVTKTEPHDRGRWPANVTLDETAAAMLDEQTGEIAPSARIARRDYDRGAIGASPARREGDVMGHADTGGASRFFYCPKADREERNRGLEGFEERRAPKMDGGEWHPEGRNVEGTAIALRNHHPTVKPVELMRWLCRMVTPPKGTVLDPFCGSGSTGVAAMREGFEFIGIEREAEYLEIARSRIYGDSPLFNVEVGGGPTE